MPRQPASPWPTGHGSVFFADAASQPTLSRAVTAGRIRRLASGVYSADPDANAAELISRNRWEVIAHLIPDALVADRSAAADGTPIGGAMFIVSNQRIRPLSLPGLVVAPRRGPGPLPDDLVWASGLRISSEARTLVDNLAVSRTRAGRASRTLSLSELEAWLVRKAQLRPESWLANLRTDALRIAQQLGVAERREGIEDLIGAVAGTRPVRAGAATLLAARRAGLEFDPARIGRFDELAAFLADIPTELGIPEYLPPPAGDLDGTLPFYEAYFSNFIEGTEFSIEEAEQIVASGEVPANRPADGHDIIGTFRTVADPVGRAAVPASAEDFLQLLTVRHQAIMGGRPDRHPGRFKQSRNQAGSYVFVDPALVEGTLVEGFRRTGSLPDGFARAAYMLFLVSEVHPFDDGNGRVSRVAACAELSAGGQARIVIPIVFRNEYQTAMRELSRSGRADLYVRTLAWAWRWTAGMPWSDPQATAGRLAATNALTDSTDAELRGVRLELP
ncbi:MAG: Fic family protein [Acidimicrobiales bacterium]